MAQRISSLPAQAAGRYAAPGINVVYALPDQRWLVPTGRGAQLVVLDAELRPIWRFDLPEGNWPGQHAVSSDLQLIALSRRSEVRLLAADGSELQRFPHPPWGLGGSKSGACAFDQDGRTLWAYVTTEQEGDELLLIDLPSKTVVDRALTSTQAEGVMALAQPGGPWMGWSVGEGQDGAFVLWSRREEDRLVLRQDPDDTRILADVHAQGSEYLTTPHSGELLQRHSLEDGTVLAETEAPQGEDEETSWGFSAVYLSPEMILATAFGEEGDEPTYLLERDSLTPLARVDYPDEEPGWLAAASTEAWLTVDQDGVHRWILEK